MLLKEIKSEEAVGSIVENTKNLTTSKIEASVPTKEEAKEPLPTSEESKAAPEQAMKDAEAETTAKK